MAEDVDSSGFIVDYDGRSRRPKIAYKLLSIAIISVLVGALIYSSRSAIWWNVVEFQLEHKPTSVAPRIRYNWCLNTATGAQDISRIATIDGDIGAEMIMTRAFRDADMQGLAKLVGEHKLRSGAPAAAECFRLWIDWRGSTGRELRLQTAADALDDLQNAASGIERKKVITSYAKVAGRLQAHSPDYLLHADEADIQAELRWIHETLGKQK